MCDGVVLQDFFRGSVQRWRQKIAKFAYRGTMEGSQPTGQMMRLILMLAVALAAPVSVRAVTINTVLVGNPGNPFEVQPQGIFGSVSTTYRIGITEVTNAQYVEFLNAVAASDPYGLYDTFMGFSTKGGITRDGSSGSYTYAVKPFVPGEGPGGTSYTYGDKPVVFISWYDAIRFANWMHNGQGNADTETGAYTIGPVDQDGLPLNGDSITRSAGAKWFLPSENEWYKAAYYNPATSTYFSYPTGSSTAPDNNLPSMDSGNSANFLQGSNTTTGNLDYPHTTAGAYIQSDSPYGTLDQGGNVWEWNESLISASTRGRRGGAWNSGPATLASSNRGSLFALLSNDSTGFRLASISDPDGLTGDFNNDGVVDAADYVVWRKTGGTAQQYIEWRANFGLSGSGSGGSLSVAVPESASVFLMSLGIAGLTSYFWRRRPAPLLHAS